MSEHHVADQSFQARCAGSAARMTGQRRVIARKREAAADHPRVEALCAVPRDADKS